MHIDELKLCIQKFKPVQGESVVNVGRKLTIFV